MRFGGWARRGASEERDVEPFVEVVLGPRPGPGGPELESEAGVESMVAVMSWIGARVVARIGNGASWGSGFRSRA